MFSSRKRSAIMAAIKSQGNRTTELKFIRLMHSEGIKGWRRGSKLPGRPDFVFAKGKIAVFIDGDFWHGNPRRFRLPKTNVAYWRKKIMGNRRRDQAVTRNLRKMGWSVARLWESSLKDGDAALLKLKTSLLHHGITTPVHDQ